MDSRGITGFQVENKNDYNAHDKITELHYRDTVLQDKEFADLLEQLASQPITTLSLKECNLRDAEAIALAEFIRNHAHLTNVRISRDQITATGVEALRRALAHAPKLKEVELLSADGTYVRVQKNMMQILRDRLGLFGALRIKTTSVPLSPISESSASESSEASTPLSPATGSISPSSSLFSLSEGSSTPQTPQVSPTTSPTHDQEAEALSPASSGLELSNLPNGWVSVARLR